MKNRKRRRLQRFANKNKTVQKHERFDNAKYYLEYGIDIEKRRIMLDNEVDEYSVGLVIRAVRRMIDDSKSIPIDIYINTDGGSVYDGLALYDCLRACSYTKIRTHAFGRIFSMGVIIYLAGDERFSTPNSTFMAHSVSGGSIGKTHELKTDTKETERINNVLLEILADRTNKTKAWWQKEIQFEDKYYSKKKAVELGIVTKELFEVE